MIKNKLKTICIVVACFGAVCACGFYTTTLSNKPAYADAYSDCLGSYGLYNIPSWQRACWNHVTRGGNFGALWIASTGNAGSPEIEVYGTEGWQTVALYGLVAGHASGYQGGASNINFQSFNDTFHNYPSLLYRWGVYDWDRRLNSSNMSLHIPNFIARASRSVDSDGIRYRADVPVYRCWSPDPAGSDSCYDDPIGVTLFLRGFQARFDSATSLSYIDPKTQEEKTATANHDHETATADNYILNPTKTEEDPYEYTVHFKHQITRTDEHTAYKAADNWRTGPSSGDGSPTTFHGDTMWYNPGDSSTKKVDNPQNPQDDDSTIKGEVDVGKNENVCYGISHYQTTLMGYDGRQLKGWDWYTSRACVNVIHLANFQLEDDVSFDNKDVVYAGETTNLIANFYNYKAPRSDINHTASPKDTKYRQVYFYTNGLEEQNLTGGTVDNEDQICTHFGLSAEQCERQKSQIAGLEDGNNNQVAADDKRTQPISINVDDINVTDNANKLCVAVAANPSKSLKEPDKEGRSVEDNWIVSNATCRTIAKKPSINIKAGNTYAANGLIGLTALKNVNGKTLFGSWAEYLVLSKSLDLSKNPSPISKFASGAYLAGGIQSKNDPSICQYSPLSMASSQCRTGDPPSGYIGGAALNDSNQFLSNIMKIYGQSPLPDGTRISAVEIEPSSSNRKTVIFVDGTVVIDRRITIPKDQPYSTLSEIPQVIILAKDIKITKDVDQIDAWLIAYGDKKGDIYEGGKIETCPGFQIGGSVDECNAQLTINGPVVAKEFYPYRSAGANPGAASGTPAETITLTPAAYEWGYQESSGDSPSQAHTVYSREIAPRL